MTRPRTNIVPFERPAAYWAIRARKHCSPSQLPDAARMMRKALEKSGDSGLALELAEIYSGMGCYTAAERCLIRAAVRQGLTGSLCYAIGVCALNRGSEDLGEEALDRCLRLEPNGFFAERAQDLLEYYAWKPLWYQPHTARSDALCRRSMRALAQADVEKAVVLARKGWEKGASPRAALWLGMLLPPREALPYLKTAAEKLPLELKAQIKYAEACSLCRRLPEARKRLASARRLCRSITDAEEYCAAAWTMNRPKDALKLAESKLKRLPQSVDYLRLKYLSLRRMGEEAQAKRTLETLLEIDPDDADALFDRRHPRQTSLHDGRGMLLTALGGMVWSLPDTRRPGPLNRALHLMVMNLNGTVDAEAVFRLLPPLWRKLTPAEQYACDAYRDVCFPALFTVYLLICTGHWEEARRAAAAAPGRKRVLRLLARCAGIRKNGE
ncbi:MAG: hypothetical protein IK099_09525 [Clostridia bacterium]|nr:hypothetical protein [Clostridia bacterium]